MPNGVSISFGTEICGIKLVLFYNFFAVTYMFNVQLYEVSPVTRFGVSLYISDCSLQQLWYSIGRRKE